MRPDNGFVIIGGGPTALATARAYRESGGSGRVHMLSGDADPPYARPPLSKEFLRGQADENDLPLQDPSFYAAHDIQMRLDDAVVDWDITQRTVTTAAGDTVPYDRCLYAAGAEPKRPPVPGADHPRVRTLRSARSGQELRTTAQDINSAVVVGAGFIGCEAAVSLSRRGVSTTLLCPEPQPHHQRLGPDAGEEILGWLSSEGVNVHTATRLLGIDDGTRVRTDTTPALDTDLVLLATGIAPRTRLAERAGLTIADGRVRADEQLRTNAAGVHAAGDAALAHNETAGRALPVEHWGEAEIMGEIAGANAAGEHRTWHNAPGFFSVIGDRVLKYAAWGDGFTDTEMVRHDHPYGAFTVWYGHQGVTVGVLTHDADDDYARGVERVERAAPFFGAAVEA